MSRAAPVLERRRLRAVAREYERRGYEVLVGPKRSDLPDFLHDLEPDLIAHNEKEWVVVEVKSQPSLVQNEHLSRLADAVKGRPDWRFELVVTNPVKRTLADTHDLIDVSDIRRLLDTAHDLMVSGSPESAMLVVWSAAEGALRHIAQAESIQLDEDSPAYLLKKLTISGSIDPAVYEVLHAGMDARNALVHGFQAHELSPQLVDQVADVVYGLIAINGLSATQ
jgi:hypothetical protein